jgi:hypothetical protein
MGASVSAVVFVLSIFLVPESKYHRSLAAYGQEEADASVHNDETTPSRRVKLTERPALDFVSYKARTIRSDMTLFSVKPDWAEGYWTFIVRFMSGLLIGRANKNSTPSKSCSSRMSCGHSYSTE